MRNVVLHLIAAVWLFGWGFYARSAVGQPLIWKLLAPFWWIVVPLEWLAWRLQR